MLRSPHISGGRNVLAGISRSMRTRIGRFLIGLAVGVTMALRSAAVEAQVPSVYRDTTLGTVSDFGVALAGASIALTPRFRDVGASAAPDWEARWHVSALAPIATLTMLTVIVDAPVRGAFEGPRPGCTVDQTIASVSNSGCETFGGPSTHAFASFGALGVGLGVFLVDTLRSSRGRVHGLSLLGNIVLPAAGSMMVVLGRSVAPAGTAAYEDRAQLVAGVAPGLGAGLALGLLYAAMQPPSCAGAGLAICW